DGPGVPAAENAALARDREGRALPGGRHRRARRGRRGGLGGRRRGRRGRPDGGRRGLTWNRQHEGTGTMNHLLRGHAPLTDSNWKLLDEEARERLAGPLAARRLVDFLGPQGWKHSSTNLGRVEPVDADKEGVSALQRRVLPLVEVRVDFTVSRAEMRDD